MAKHSLTSSELVAFNHAAAGHDGVLSDSSGALVIKPCTPAEIAFYESAPAHPAFAAYMPTFMGTLSLCPHADSSAAAAAVALTSTPTPNFTAPTATATANTKTEEISEANITQDTWTPSQGRNLDLSTAIVLSNAAFAFKHPNVLDVKLGARLWADDAPPSKRARLDKVSAETTSASLGFRIAGMKVWQGPDDTADAKNDSEKRGIDGEGYRVYDKNYGRGFVGREDVRGAFEEFLCVKRAEVTRGLGEKVARRLREEVRGMERVLAGEESRMFSASILFVYEGDGEVLARGLEEEESEGRRCDGDKGDEEVDEEDEEGDDDDDDDDDDDVEGPHIAVAKLIDFAHASWTPGQGPDENALQGVRNVLSILTDLSAS